MSDPTQAAANPSGGDSDSNQPVNSQPITPSDRNVTLDALRGVAVLGILVINMWYFALPQFDYLDTLEKGGNATLNLATWIVSAILFEGKMRALLSMLFGAGVVLLTSRIEDRGGQSDTTDIHYRRNIWLVLIGAIHAYFLIWPKDILVAYALVAFVLFPFRKMRAESLIVIGMLCLAVLVPKRILQSNQLSGMQTAAVEAKEFLDKNGNEEGKDSEQAHLDEKAAQSADEPVERKLENSASKNKANAKPIRGSSDRSPSPTLTPLATDDGLFEYEEPDPPDGSFDSESDLTTDVPRKEASDSNPQKVEPRGNTLDPEQSDKSDPEQSDKSDPEQSDKSDPEQSEDSDTTASEQPSLVDAKKPKDDESGTEAEAEADESEDEKQKKQRQAVRQWNSQLKVFRPTEQQQQEKIERHRSNYWTLFKKTASQNVAYQSTYFYTWLFWDVAGMMFIGMGLMKLGVFSGDRPSGVYVLLLAGGYGIGLPISVFAVYRTLESKFDVPDMFLTSVIEDAGRLTMALGHVAVVVLICKLRLWSWLTMALAAAGRMALSNYVAQTVICTLIFNGYGLGLYGRPERWHTMLLVIAIWFAQLIISSYWLVYFRYGPLEWLWRSLTYLKGQPMFVGQDPAAETSAAP